MYDSRLQQLGFHGKSVNSSRLKDRILASIPDLQAHQQGRDILLAFKDDIGVALQKVLEEDNDTEAKHLAKAAGICRREMLSSKSTFQGTFEEHCQEDSVPSSLKSLIKMILYGPNIKEQLENNTSQAALTIAQLLQFNCSSRRREERTSYGHRHNKDRETPVPLYLGLFTHALTRKRELIYCLYKLGISISYDRVLSILTDIGNTVCRRYEEEGVLCPSKLRKELFRTAAIDNIDHNPSSNAAQDSFHGTGISLFQNTYEENTGVKRDTVVLEQIEGESSKTVCPLPDWYTEVPPCVLRDNKASIPLIDLPQVSNNDVLTGALETEYEWLEEVKSSTESESYQGEKPISWSGYHANINGSKPSLTPAVTALLPLFPDEAKSVAMIRHAMDVIKAAILYLNPGQIPIIAVDQPLYSIAKQIQWNWPDTHGEQLFVFMLGGLHIEMAVLSVLGDWLEDSGWVNSLVEASIATPGVANSFLKGSNVKRTRHAHHVTASALYCLLKTAYILAKENEDVESDLSMDEWCKQRSEASPQFQFWYITLQLQLQYSLFVRSLRESNFPLYLKSLCKLVPWFFALNHVNYARWVPVHLRDMETLQAKHPEIYQQFLKGGFTVKKTTNAFSAIAIDQAHEQNNSLVKGEGGAVGLTENPSALRRWMISGPEIARMVEEFQGCFTEGGKESKKHHEEAKSYQVSFAKEVKSLTSVIENMGNPFTEETADLLVLDTRDIVDEKVVKTVQEIEALGQQQFETFQSERLSENRKSLYEPIKKNKLSLFRSPNKKEPSKEKQQISSLKSDCALFSRLYISCQTRNGDLDNFFKHENQGCPPSLSQNGKLRLPSKKSDLLDGLETLLPSSTSVPDPIDVMVLDGAAIISMLKPTSTVKNFDDYADQVFIPYIKGQLQHVLRVDVFDEYLKDSLKATTRCKRGTGIRRWVQSLTIVPKNWRDFLRVEGNKTELFSFLAQKTQHVDFGHGRQVIITKGDQVVCSPSCDTSGLAPCNHEEADTRMIVHVADAVQAGYGKIAIRTVDTDVIVICIAAINHFQGTELWVLFGTGTNHRSFAIHSIASILGPDKSRSLPVFHALTGCDTVSSFSGIGKKTAWSTWMLDEEVTAAFLECSRSPDCISDECLKKMEHFVVLLYDRASTKSLVNDARKQLFAQKGRSLEAIPPTQAALLQHIKRAVLQGGYCWGQAASPVMSLPSPSEWGWKQSSDGWTPLWTTLPDVSASCELIRCGCKKGCRSRCSCAKAVLKCTALCLCGGECSSE